MNDLNYFEKNMEKKVNQNISTILLKGIMAGFFIALASMLSISVSSTINNYSISKLLSALVFPIGLILVVVFKTELFTGNILVIIPLINKKIKISQGLKLLIISYIGNLIGSLIAVILISNTNHFEINNYLIGNSTIKIAESKINLTNINAFTLGILCNILVCIAVYLASISKTYIEKIISCIIPIFSFVLLGFEHSVANMYYLFAAFSVQRNLIISSITINGILNNLLFVTLGNIIGGFIIGFLINIINNQNEKV